MLKSEAKHEGKCHPGVARKVDQSASLAKPVLCAIQKSGRLGTNLKH